MSKLTQAAILVVGIGCGYWYNQEVFLKESNTVEFKPTSVEIPVVELAAVNVSCSNREPDDLCEQYASEGACLIHQNMGWMSVACAKSCKTCSMLHYPARCNRKRIPSKPAITNNQLEPLFLEMSQRARELGLQPKFLSKSPEYPNVLELSNFVTDSEIDALLETAGRRFVPSEQRNAAALTESGTQPKLRDDRRFSETAACTYSSGCKGHKEVEKLLNRMEYVMGISQLYFENLQLLRYRPGMYYKVHHDMSEKSNTLVCGARILTMFIYLNDVEGGGGTRFPDITPPGHENGLVVTPQKGRVVVWPSVLNEDVLKRDNRTFHEALEVTSGVKLGTNVWVRLHDFVNASRWGCAGFEF